MESLNLKAANEDEMIIRLKELYRRYGYLRYRMSKFEEYDLYVENKNFLVSDDIITFSDFNGKLMALKPDVTLSILKKVQSSNGTEKLFYNEHVYRALKNTREVREIMQMGLECIGDVGVYETGEVVSLAAKSLETVAERYVIDVSHMGYLNGMLEAAGMDFSLRSAVLKMIREKNPHDLRKLCGEKGVDSGFAESICRTASLWGSFAEVLPELKTMSVNEETDAAICELEAVFAILEANGVADQVKIDFSVINDMNYYNGIVFQGFVEGIPVNILSGGRYDKLLEKFDRQSGAIGFAVYLGMLGQYMSGAQNTETEIFIYYDDASDLKRLAESVRDFTEAGQSVSVRRKGSEGPVSQNTVRYEMNGGRLTKL